MEKFDFNKREYDHFVEYCGFTDEELIVFQMRRKGSSITEVARNYHRSEATVNRIIKCIKAKIKYEIIKGQL